MELVSAPLIRLACVKGYHVVGKEIFGPKGKLKPQHRFGPPYVCVRSDGRSKKVSCHAIAAYQKFGEKMFKRGVFVRHLDADDMNFSPDNLELMNNCASLDKNVRVARAYAATAVVRVHDHQGIREAYAKGMSYKEIMKAFGISSKGTVSYIIKTAIRSNPAHSPTH